MTTPFPTDGSPRRIGPVRPSTADIEALTTLHQGHLEHVPFENLVIHRGVPIELGTPTVTKIIDRRRGGFGIVVERGRSARMPG